MPLLAAGEIDTDVGGHRLPYYSMPFIEGESLRHRLARGELPVTQAIRVLRDVADALAFAHERGIVHRDVKPDNVLLSGDHASVIDFGVARALEASVATTETLTGTGVAIGTPAYMAPEQAVADRSADHRVDIYAFGLLAFEALVGAPAFSGRPQQLLAAQVSRKLPSVAELRPATPPVLAALIAQCLEKRPADRPQTARDVLRVLETLGGVSADSQAIDAKARPRLAAPAPTHRR